MRQALLLFGFAFLIACSKESDENTCGDPTVLHKVQLNNYVTQAISYNKNCRLKETTEPFLNQNFIFNNQNQLIKIEEKMSFDGLSCYMPTGATGERFTDPKKAKVTSYVTIEYGTDGTIAKKNFFSNYADSYKQVSYETFHYLDSRVDRIEKFSPKDEFISYNAFEYDENGNVKSDNYYLMVSGNPELRITNLYQYDNKQNPFRILSQIGTPGKYTNTNNIVSERHINYYNEEQMEYTISYTFEYNELGYPSKVNDQIYVYGK